MRLKKDQIKIGKKYSNGKGRIREVVDIGDFPLYSGQTDHDCVKYEVINDGSKKNRTYGNIGTMTRTSFASWAKEILHDEKREMNMDLLAKIKACQTMRELDELRYEVVEAMQKYVGTFTTLQTAFIHKGNSLKRQGHTRSSEGYTLHEVMEAHHAQEGK